jgi:CrcB protein
MGTWDRVLVLSIGGALGVNARYWVGVGMGRWTGPRFPWSTVAVNVSGSFAIGVAAVLLAHRWPHPMARLFVVTGFLGGYTTFSAFAFESLTLWERGDRGLSAANSIGSVAAGLAAVALGVALGRWLVGSSGQGDGLTHRPGLVVEPADAVELAPSPLLVGEVQHGPEDGDHLGGDQEAPPHRRGHRPDHLAANAGGPEHRPDRDDGLPPGQEPGPEPVDRPFKDGLSEPGHRPDPG